jgi:large subunit ribosomal protein L23
MKSIYDVLQGPRLTEKASILQETDKQVVLQVNPKANKIDIKKAVEKMFNVTVKDVRTARVHGKQKRVGRFIGMTNDWKKAYVTLAEGEINFTEEL